MPSNGNEPARGMYPLQVDPPEKASQTLLNKISDCPFSGGLYLKHKGGAQRGNMARGEAIHQAIEISTAQAIEDAQASGDPIARIPPDVAKDNAQAILDERVDLAMSPAEHDACRVALWNWASEAVLDPSAIVCIETMLEVEIGGWMVRGKIDRAEIIDGDGRVIDYKTGLGYPDQEEFDNDFQMQLYGLLLLEGCPEGETVPLGRGLSGVHLIGEYPRVKREGMDSYFRRHTYKDRAQIHDFRRTVESALRKLDSGLETGLWKASPGGHCDFCPARHECPIPDAELPKTIATEGQAREVAEHILVVNAELKDERTGLKKYLEENGGELVVGDRVFGFTPTESEKIVNREVLYAAMRNAGLEPADYFTVQRSNRFGDKKVKA